MATSGVDRISWVSSPIGEFDDAYNLAYGSSSGNPGRAEGREIIRNSRGEWVSGYARAIRHTTSVAAKLWALRDGINLCIDLNLTNVIIELDAKFVVDLLQNEEGRKNGNEVIIADCREGLKKISRVRVQHCFREANMCANALVRKGAFLSQDFVIFHSPHLMFLF
nr:putative ribonuclease h protein [Quercus suber]